MSSAGHADGYCDDEACPDRAPGVRGRVNLSPPTGGVHVPAGRLTVAGLDTELVKHGLSTKDVSLNPAPRIDQERRGRDAPLVLVVTTYARNAEGKRYIDTETGEAATETHRIPLATLTFGSRALARS